MDHRRNLSTMAVKRIFKIFVKAFEGKAQTKFIDVIEKIVTVALKVPPNSIPVLDCRSWKQASAKGYSKFYEGVRGQSLDNIYSCHCKIVTVAPKVLPNGIPALD